VTSPSPDKKPLEPQLANPATRPSTWKKRQGVGVGNIDQVTRSSTEICYTTQPMQGISLKKDEYRRFFVFEKSSCMSLHSKLIPVGNTKSTNMASSSSVCI